MHTTKRKRNISISNLPYNRSHPLPKKRKLNSNNNHNGLSQTQIQSFHQQLLAIKNKHWKKEENEIDNLEQKDSLNDTLNDTLNDSLNDSLNNFLEIDDNQNEQDWDDFINSTDFENKTIGSEKGIKIKVSDRMKNTKLTLVETAISTESQWLDFFNTRYDENDERDKLWKEPEINTFWDQGPIGIIKSWWDDNQCRKYINIDQEYDNQYNDNLINKKKMEELTQSELSKKKQKKMIKKDIIKELKQQKLEKKLRDRIEKGQIVKDLDNDNNPFESFFDAALEMGQDIRAGKINPNLEKKEVKKKERKTKIIRPKLKKLKQIATFKNDDLFFFDESDEERNENNDNDNDDVIANINENDMIHIKENSIANNKDSGVSLIASKIDSEKILLQQRIKMQREQMKNNMIMNEEENKKSKKKNGIINSNILSDTFEDSLKEKKILKKLNIMDYVTNYKNAFFREVEELNLNPSSLVDHWQTVKKNDGLSRRLRKKLGIIMARERAKRARINNFIHQ